MFFNYVCSEKAVEVLRRLHWPFAFSACIWSRLQISILTLGWASFIFEAWGQNNHQFPIELWPAKSRLISPAHVFRMVYKMHCRSHLIPHSAQNRDKTEVQDLFNRLQEHKCQCAVHTWMKLCVEPWCWLMRDLDVIPRYWSYVTMSIVCLFIVTNFQACCRIYPVGDSA